MKLNLLHPILVSSRVLPKGIYLSLLCLLLVFAGQAQVSILEGDTAYICQSGNTSQNLSVTAQPGYTYKWYNVNNPVWYQVGSFFGNSNTSYPSMAFKGNVPYVAMKDTISSNIIVSRYNGVDWEQVGASLPFGVDQKIAIKGDTIFVAFGDLTDPNGRNSVYKYNGTSWVKVGNSVGGTNVSSNLNFASRSLVINGGVPYVSFVEGDSSSRIVTYKFDGSAWVPVGNAFGPTNSLVPTLSFNLDTAYVVTTNTNNFSTEVFKFDGTSWVQVGSGVGVGYNSTTYKPTISFNGNTPYIAFTDASSSNENVVYTFNGTSWVKVGNSFGTFGVPDIKFSNGIGYVLIRNVPFNGYSYSVFTYNGTSWVKFDSSFGGQFGGEHSFVFDASGNPNAIFKEGSPSVLSVYKFGPQIVSDTNTFTASTAGKYVVEEMTSSGTFSYDTISVLNAPSITANITATAVGCLDGNLNLTVNGGAAPYSYLWSSGQTTQNLISVGVGYYTVEITDSFDCTASAQKVLKARKPTADNFIAQDDTALICMTNPAVLSVNPVSGSTYQWYKVDSTNWQQIGNSIGGFPTQTPSLFVNDSTPFVAFSNGNENYRNSVYFYNGLNWQQLGNAFGSNSDYGQSLVFNNGTPYVACNSFANSGMAVYKFDGTNWTQLGGFFGNSGGVARLSFDGNTPYVAFIDQSNSNKVSVFKFDGTTWSQVGSSFGGSWSSSHNLGFNGGIPYVVMSDPSFNYKTTVYAFDGANWSIVGAAFGADYSFSQSLAFNAGVPYVAFADNSNNSRLVVYSFNGSSWVPFGGGVFGGTGNSYVSLRFNGGLPYVASSEGGNDNLSVVHKYDGTAWVKVGDYFGSEGSYYQTIAFSGATPYVSYIGSGSQVYVYRLGDAYMSDLETFSANTTGTYVAIQTEASGCLKSDTVTVIQQSIQPPVATAIATSTSCSNASTGAINLTVTLGAAPYSYTWSNSATSEDISNLSIGTYSVTVIDSIGCSATALTNITETPIAQATLIAQGDSAFACGTSPANMSVFAIPGYQYQWIELDSLKLQQLGDPLGGNYSYDQSVKVNNGVPYVALSDGNSDYQTSVYMHDGNNWVKLGSSFGNDDSYSQKLSFNNNVPYVAFVDGDSYEVMVYSFNGTDWVQLGGAFGDDVSTVSLDFKVNTPYVAFNDGNNDYQTTVYMYNGSAWVQVGTSFGGDNSRYQNLSISDTTIYVSFTDPDNDEQVSVFTFNGSAWVQVGSEFGSPYSERLSLAVNNGIPFVAFTDGNSYANVVYKFDSTDWVQVGSDFGESGVREKSLSFKDTIPYLAFIDGNDYVLMLYQFDGTNWKKVSGPKTGESYGASLTFDGEIAYVAFSDEENFDGQTFVYNFAPSIVSTSTTLATNREGNYVVRTNDPAGCRLADTVYVKQKNSPVPQVVSTITPSCVNISAGSINLAVSNGTSPYTYSWSTGATTQNVSLLPIGSYSVVVTDSIGCSMMTKAKVEETPAAAVNIITRGDVISQCGADTNMLSVVQVPGYAYKWFKADSLVWQQVGSSFGGEYSAVQRLVFDGNTPYVAFRDADDDGRISVYTLTSGAWVQVGSNFGDGNETGWIDGLTLSLRINEGIPYVAFSDYEDYQISLYKFDGTDWVQVGDKFGDESQYQSLSFNGNTPYVAFEDQSNNRKSVVYYYNGADWEQLGDAFGEYSCQYQSLEIHNGVPYVAFVDGDDDQTYVYKYNGTIWEQVGSSFGGEDARYHSLVFDNNTPYVAIAEDDSYNSVYQFNGTNWVKVGPSFGGYSYFTNLTFKNGVPYVAFSDENQNYQSTVYRFNGTTWEQVGSSFGGESAFQSIAFNGDELYLAAYAEDNDYETTVYKFSAAEIATTNQVIVQTPGRYVVKSTDPDGCRGLDTVLVVNYLSAGNNTTGDDQVICNGSTPTDFLANTPGLGDTTTYSYTWLSSTVSAMSGFAPASGVNNTATYTPVPLTDTIWYKRIVTSNVCPADTSDALAIMVTADSAGTWTGAQNWVWANPANWSCPSIPTGVSRVTIPSTASYMPSVIDARQVLDLTVQNGATLSFGSNATEFTVFGNVTVDGNLSAFSGKLILAGTAQQTIPGAFYRKLEVNNPAGVNMNGSITVGDSLILKNGIVSLGSNNLTLAWQGYASKGSPASYVSTNGTGKFRSDNVGGYGKSDTVYIPVGNSTFNPVSIIDNNNNSNYEFRVIDSVTSNYSGYNPIDTAYTNGAVNRTWVIEQSNGGANSASISFGWTAANELPFFNRNNSFVSYFNTNDTDWVTSPGTVASGSSIFYQTITGVTTNNVFTIGSGTGVGVPVTLLSFAATKQRNDVNVTWATATEVNNDYFELERSVDGRTFEVIAKVKGNGTTNLQTNYQYLDTKVAKIKRPTPNVFYRLVQVDFDGTKTISRTVVINIDEQAGSQKLTASISPNPFADITNVFISSSVAERAILKVTDAQGRLVFEKQVELQQGQNQLIIDELGTARSGIYFVNIVTSNESVVQRIAKE
ncbi:MAG: T9SS type A sorting domain-containing protein [Bacteroidia bacterium]|jgi:hypothetical protein|nr:T9SS type A sorting domain-containing protein [Bacteroidia bacterium]